MGLIVLLVTLQPNAILFMGLIVFFVKKQMLLDVGQGLFLLVHLTFKYNDGITCMCLTYHLRSHMNQTPKMLITKCSKLGCTLR